MAFADRGSHKLYFETLGRDDAPPVLLVMGLGLSSRGWGTLPERLATHFRVVTFDNRGTGRSTRTAAMFRVVDLADDAAAVLDAAGLERAAVFGISMGGMIAIELALRHAARVHALALGCTYGGYLRSQKASASALVDFVRAIASPRRGTRETTARRRGALLRARTGTRDRRAPGGAFCGDTPKPLGLLGYATAVAPSPPQKRRSKVYHPGPDVP